MFISNNRPCRGITTYATIGLAEYDIGLMNHDLELRIELLGTCDTSKEFFANILASTAFEIMKLGKCRYGMVVNDVIKKYVQDSDMKHVYLMNPFLWDGFETVNVDMISVAWLLIVPISDAERDYLQQNGFDALETKFEEMEIDIFDIYRNSVINS